MSITIHSISAINIEEIEGTELYSITSRNINKIFVIGLSKTIGRNHSGNIDIGYITGHKYINAVTKTEYKCIISLNFTVIAANINPTPNEKNTIKNKGKITNKTV